MAENQKSETEYVIVQRVSPFFNKLLILFLIGATLWNWDGLWEFKPVQPILEKSFPSKYQQEADKRERAQENSKLYRFLFNEREQAKKSQKDAEEKLKDKCGYVRTAAAMFREEHEKVKKAAVIENVKIVPIDCDTSESPQRCNFIKQYKVEEICPE